MTRWLSQKLTTMLARFLTSKVRHYEPFAISTPETLAATLRMSDVLLVEGNQRFSIAVKYLTQSTWSHAAIYVGEACGLKGLPDGTPTLIEADLENGIVAVPLTKYADFNTRICRPVGLDENGRRDVAQFMSDSIGMTYDLKNVVDLARYLVPTPPVPTRWRRRMLALGSGDPTRAICSTRIAEAFQSIGYPILPKIEHLTERECAHCRETVHQVLHIRHYSLFTPRDFDVSPYFRVVKPTIDQGFDYKRLIWGEQPENP
jgi:hypothetical protein